MSDHSPTSDDVEPTGSTEEFRSPPVRRLVLGVVHLLGAAVFLIAMIVILISLFLNMAAFYNAEVGALETMHSAIFTSTTLAANALFSATLLIVVCILALVVTIGETVILIQTGFLEWLDQEIERLKRLCPLAFWNSPLSFGAWLDCRMRLSTLRIAYWGLIALFAVAVTISLINIIGFIAVPR